MRAYIIRRLLQSLIVLNAVLLIVFLMLQITGDPAAVLLPLDATKEDLARFRHDMGFDQPLHVQYFNFLFGHGRSKGVLRGDFGFSFGCSQCPRVKQKIWDMATIKCLYFPGL